MRDYIRRPLRPDTQALVDQLARPAHRRWPRLFADDERLALIGTLGQLGEAAVVPALVPLLLDGDQAERRAAASAIAALLAPLPAGAYAELAELRGIRSEWTAPAEWLGMQPRQVADLAGLPGEWAVLGIASLHGNGYVREAALRALMALDDERVLPFLLLRVNDWVPVLRSLACAAVEQRLQPPYAEALLRALPLVLALRRSRRADHGALVAAVLAFLRSPAAHPTLLRSSESGEPATRRECFRLLLAAPAPALVERALADRDFVVRSLGAASLSRLPAGAARQALVERAAIDSSALVRRHAFRLVDELPPARQRRLLERALTDSTATLRRDARARLPALAPELDVAALCRAQLATPRLRGALLALGECGSEDDALLVEPFTTDRRVKVRAAALRATALLDRDSVSPFLTAIADPALRVSRAAALLLSRRPRPGLFDELLTLAAQPDLPEHVRRHALDVVDTALPWTRLAYLLRAAASPRPELAALATARLEPPTWSQPPTADERAVIERALATTPLAAATHAAIERALADWRR